jgi:Ser/Thr protein kinase RdoA (MazF antagonist)
MSAQPYDPSALLEAWPIGRAYDFERTPQGSIHQVYRVQAASGEFYLRVYRYAEPQPIALEHALIAHVRASGIPAVPPLASRTGATLVTHDGRHAALVPRAAGIPLGEAARSHAAACGAFLARVHSALASFPLSRVPRRTWSSERPATLRDITRYEAMITARGALGESDERALLALARQRAWLLDRPAAATERPAFPQQAIHGDYNAANLFADQGSIVAIIDWDQSYQATCGWEVLRALDILLGYEVAPCADFIAAYRAERALPLAELDQAAEQYALMRAHDLWKFAAIYEQGNQRIRAFLPPEGFVAHDERWRAIRAALPPG